MNYEIMGNSALPPLEGQFRKIEEGFRLLYAERKGAEFSLVDTGAGSKTNFKDKIFPGSTWDNAHWLCGADRLENKKWIPYNDLEISRNIVTLDNKFINVEKWFDQEYLTFAHDGAHGFMSPLDYFATLQGISPDSIQDIINYINVLTFPDITGVSFKKNYIDPDLQRVADANGLNYPVYTYRGWPEINSMYQGFWEMYWYWVEKIRDKIVSYIMTRAIIQQHMAQQFDFDSLGSFIRNLRDTILNDLFAGQGYADALIGMPHELIRQYVRYGTYQNLYQQIGDPVRRSLANIVSIPVDSDFVKTGIVSGKSTMLLSPAQRVKEIWDNAILPSKIQLDNMIAVWNRLQMNPGSLTTTDIDNLYNIDRNVFLGFDPIKTAEMKQVMYKQLARSTLIEALPEVVVAPKALQVMYQPVLDIEKSKSQYFTPMFSYSTGTKPGTGMAGGGVAEKSNLPLILAGVAAAAAIYYSYK